LPPRKRADVARAPVPPARPEPTAIKALRWLGTIALLVAAAALWIWVELRKPMSPELQRLNDLQHRIQQIDHQPVHIDFKALEPLKFEPLQTAELIPSSAIVPAKAQPALQTATPISRP
jgi:hypothetical protein